MKQRILFVALALLLLTACHKENPDPRMEITIEKLQGNGKLTLDGLTATWNDGDTLRLNGTPVVVERSGDHAYISNTAALSTNRALFPTRLVASGPTSDNITVTLPREYDYRSDGTHQQLTLPLAARATDGEPLHFQHLTGALCFMLTNSTSHPLTIDKIVVSSNKYQLSGERAINLGSIGSIGPNDGTGDDLTVAMTFTKQSLVIPASGNANVVLPIAPVGSDNIFTVSVIAHHEGKRYTYTHTQGENKTDRSLNRNEIGYAGITINSDMTTGALFTGYGTVGNPYLITDYLDFLLMAEAVSKQWTDNNSTAYGKTYFRLENDIDLHGLSIYPIRNFVRQFDGNNHILYNLTINSRGDTCALFSLINGGTLKNLTLNNLTLKQSGNPTGSLLLGGFCGSIMNATISNCTLNNLNISITGNISSASTHIGGISARATKSNTLTDCSVITSVSFNSSTNPLYFGNIIGHCSDGATDNNDIVLTNCDATNASLSISTNNNLTFGGIVGYTTKEYLTVTGSDYTVTGAGSLTSTNTLVYAGGIVGRYNNISTSGRPCRLTISSATLTGSITASGNASSSVGTYLGKSYDSHELHINEGNNCNSTRFSITLNN